MRKPAIDWTPSQKQAIDTRGRDVLVTASAGTGKTAVLTERVVQLLADRHNPADISQILVLTFTEAAAEEMKSRIATRLRKEYVENHDPYVYRQFLELDTAQISTIHSFCRRTIRDHFYALDIDPSFEILEGDQQRLLKTRILDEVIEQAWNDPALHANLAPLLAGRNRQAAQSLLEQILGISDFLDAVVNRQDWLERACLMNDPAGPTQLPMDQARQAFLGDQLRQCRARCLHACILDQRLAEGHWSGQIAREYLQPIDAWMRQLQKGQWRSCLEQIAAFKPPNFKNKPSDLDGFIAERIKAPAKKVREILSLLGELALFHPDYERLVGPSVDRDTRTLTELTRRFDTGYARAKRELRCLDFADLERFMLRLLQDRPAVAQQLRARFSHIFVDEYQDINTVQQTILDGIRRTDNLFVVGDVKQSIYAFRQSRPQIFLDQLEAASSCGRQRVELQHNFRSRPEILRFVNVLFERIMTRESTAMDYDENARLTGGLEDQARHAGTTGHTVELVIMDEEFAEDRPDWNADQNSPDGTEIIDAAQRQAAFIAGRIREMVGVETGKAEFQIFDKETGRYRDVRYGDIVILMRSLSGRARDYVEILRLAGIPVSSQTSAGYFAATEIADMIALLNVLDNPQSDIDLAATLRSALLGFTDNELAQIRLDSPDICDADIPFHRRVFRYAQNGPDPVLRKKLADALARLSHWRHQAQRSGLADVLWQILRSTGYLAFVGALPNGRQRRANLLMLHDRAIQFEGFVDRGQGRSLRRFVEFIEQLLARQQDWAPAQPDSAEDAVRIMSVHKSKGLEFPVVVLAELNRKFNRESVTGDCIFDPEHTLGLQVVAPDRHGKIRSRMHELIAERQWAQALAEEMRILYVATTRARERLILCASRKRSDCQTILEHCAAMGAEPLPGWLLGDAACPLDWLLYGLGRYKPLQDVFQ
ncbi:MAG: UvrD-helicase domain-containing protein, partial [Sedimentisphaerales bacterium]|nr:UvrD-helicase domain-containing protein [Sedimentisphaerales bacterium]